MATSKADDIKAWTEKHGELTALMPADPTPYQRAMLDLMTAKNHAERQEARKRMEAALSADNNAKPVSQAALKKTMAEAAEYRAVESMLRTHFRSARGKP